MKTPLTLSTPRVAKKIPLFQPEWDAWYYRRAEDLPQNWDHPDLGQDLFLTQGYLQSLEDCPPKGMEFVYVLVMRSGRPIAKLYYQVQYFRAEDSIQREKEDAHCFFQTMGRMIKGWVTSRVEFYTLVLGNLLATGEHGFAFATEALDAGEQAVLVQELNSRVQLELQEEGTLVSLYLLKDFYPGSGFPGETLSRRFAYNQFCIQPNLVMELDPGWKDFGDYLEALSSKYRVRARRAAKKKSTCIRRFLEADDLKQYELKLQELYDNIARAAGFNMVDFSAGLLAAWKRNLPEHFFVEGYFFEEELIGFYCYFINRDELQAGFVGLDNGRNQEFQVYLNMLFDMVEIGIQKGCRRISFARTADTIKSSVGAVPVELNCYARHRNPFTNRFFKPILDYLRPDEPEEIRHPFRSEPS